MATVSILSVLVKSDEGSLHVAQSAPGAMKLWEGICQLLGRKMDMERKYIERLEGALLCACGFSAPPTCEICVLGPPTALSLHLHHEPQQQRPIHIICQWQNKGWSGAQLQDRQLDSIG